LLRAAAESETIVNWDDLRMLLAVARAGAIASAAKTLGVSHSTVYRRVRSFEDDHAVRIFEKSGDGYTVTATGAATIALAEQVEATVDDIARKLRTHSDDVGGPVSIIAPEAAALFVCPQLGELTRRYPALSLNWSVDADLEAFKRRSADVAIIAAAQPPADLVGRRLTSIVFGVYGAVDYLEREGIASSDDARWVVFDQALSASPVVQWESGNVSEGRVALRVNQRHLLDQAILAGLGIGVMPRVTGDAQPRLRRLVDDIGVEIPLWVLTHADLKDAPPVRAVIDEIVSIVGAIEQPE